MILDKELMFVDNGAEVNKKINVNGSAERPLRLTVNGEITATSKVTITGYDKEDKIVGTVVVSGALDNYSIPLPSFVSAQVGVEVDNIEGANVGLVFDGNL